MSTAPTTMQWLRTAARRITAGTSVLVGRLIRLSIKTTGKKATELRAGLGGWLREGDSGLAAVLRWGLLAVAAWITWALVRIAFGGGVHILAGARWLLWPAVVVFLVAAYRAGDRVTKPEAAVETPAEVEQDEESAESDEEALPYVPRIVFLAMLYAELGEGRAVHLAHLARVLARHYPEYPWDVRAVAALCAAHGITTVDKVRAHGKGATRGVRREALPPASGVFSMAPAVDVDVAGQDPSTGPSTATSTGPSTGPEGDGRKGFVITDDEVNPVRSHVHWNRESA